MNQPPATTPTTAPGTSPPTPAEIARTRAWLRRYAGLLDASIRVPGTTWKIGIDPLIGLVPGIGDWIGVLLSAVVVAHARRLGASKATQIRMLGNLAVEATVGVLPLVGDAFDAWFKANLRNVRLLEQELDRQSAGGPTRPAP